MSAAAEDWEEEGREGAAGMPELRAFMFPGNGGGLEAGCQAGFGLLIPLRDTQVKSWTFECGDARARGARV